MIKNGNISLNGAVTCLKQFFNGIQIKWILRQSCRLPLAVAVLKSKYIKFVSFIIIAYAATAICVCETYITKTK